MIAYLSMFGPNFKVVDLTLLTNLILFCFSFFIIIRRKSINLNVAKLLSSHVALALLCTFILSITGVEYPGLLVSLLKFPFYVFSALGIIFIYQFRFGVHWANYLLRHVRISGLVTCIIIFILFFLPDLRLFIYSFVDLYLLEKYNYNLNHRISDLSIGGSTLSFALALVLFEWRRFSFAQSIKKAPHLISSLIVMGLFCGATLLVGRAGFILICLYLAVEFIFSGRSRVRIELGFLFILGILGILFLYKISPEILSWSLEFFSNGFGGVKSVKVYFEQFYLPATSQSLFFGFSSAPSTSDSMILRLIFLIGAPAVIILYLGPFFPRLNRSRFSPSRFIYEPRLYLFMVFVLGNLKEGFYGNSRGAIVLLLILLFIDFFRGYTRECCRSHPYSTSLSSLRHL